jgi:hypothetical protein
MPEPQYRLAELEIALDPTRPEHILPVLSSSRVGVVDVGCGIGLFVAKGDGCRWASRVVDSTSTPPS